MSVNKEIWSMADPTMPGQPGSPTKAEIMALLSIYKGEAVSDDVREAILLTTNGNNRGFVEESLNLWNKTAKEELFSAKQKKSIGQNIVVYDVINTLALATPFIDSMELRRTNLKISLLKEIAQHVSEVV